MADSWKSKLNDALRKATVPFAWFQARDLKHESALARFEHYCAKRGISSIWTQTHDRQTLVDFYVHYLEMLDSTEQHPTPDYFFGELFDYNPELESGTDIFVDALIASEKRAKREEFQEKERTRQLERQLKREAAAAAEKEAAFVRRCERDGVRPESARSAHLSTNPFAALSE